MIVDLLFGSATHRGVIPVTRGWLDHARDLTITGESFPVAALEI